MLKAIFLLFIMLSEYLQSFHQAVMYLSTKFGENIFIQLELSKFFEI